jgi:hypothetical protein
MSFIAILKRFGYFLEIHKFSQYHLWILATIRKDLPLVVLSGHSVALVKRVICLIP